MNTLPFSGFCCVTFADSFTTRNNTTIIVLVEANISTTIIKSCVLSLSLLCLIRSVQFLKVNTSQGSVGTRFMCDRVMGTLSTAFLQNISQVHQ